ncbi:hypothetical protein SDC9_137614 [bioreactor metagenome]|jgi:hypothetical protein|uniref:2TM domain-containing protein n=1 Tax=bioreactor metagenome TaxID=1076179 RepID=A0A645DNZ2_9ZZZZ
MTGVIFIIMEVNRMHWLIRPAIGWGAWLLLHSVVVPAVYAIGKCSGKKEGCKVKKLAKERLEALETAE